MKKALTILLALALVMGLMSGVVMAEEGINTTGDFEVEYMAAPAVAGLILEEAGIDNRYGTGKTGGNFIKDVANHMGPGTDFEYPEGTVVSKTDVDEYAKAIALFLGAQLELEAVLESVVYEGYTNTFGTHAGETLTLTFSNDVFFSVTNQVDSETYVRFFGVYRLGFSPAHMLYEIDGCEVTITSLIPFSGPRPTIGDIVAEIEGIVDVLGNPVVVPASGIVVEGIVTHWMVGTWNWVNYSTHVIVINSQVDDDFSGMLLVNGNRTGTITGHLNGDEITFSYDRVGYATDGYFLDFAGEFINCNSFEGTWIHGNNGVPRNEGPYTATFTR